jgi:hypothetical protein
MRGFGAGRLGRRLLVSVLAVRWLGFGLRRDGAGVLAPPQTGIGGISGAAEVCLLAAALLHLLSVERLPEVQEVEILVSVVRVREQSLQGGFPVMKCRRRALREQRYGSRPARICCRPVARG